MITAALTVAALTAACSSSTPTHDPTPPSSSPQPSKTATSSSISTPASVQPSSSSSTATTAAIEQTIQTSWLNYWRVTLMLGSVPETQRPAKVAAVAVDPIYGELINAARSQVAAGLIGYGYIISRPSWASPPKPEARTAVMGDCFDGSHAGAKVAKTGKTRTVGEPRTNVRVTFTRGSDAKWRVHQIEYLKASC